ncbi:MAG: hypothetical protein ACKVZ0_04830 [Gemmatimonadales bacterium]
MQYRRIRRSVSSGSLGPLLLAGLGFGLAAGFILGELYAGEGTRRLSHGWDQLRRRVGRTVSPSEVTEELQQKLELALGPDAQSLELVAVGRAAVELHGWVTSRGARTRAYRAARSALAPEVRLIDRLLVWGEDDLPSAPSPTEESPGA